MSEHAPLAPSAAVRWVPCPGSRHAEAQYPDTESEAAREGTAAHWVMAEVLLNFRDGRDGPRSAAEYIGRTAPNGLLIDGKMADGADVIVMDVLKVCQQYGALQALLIEHRVRMPEVHPDHNWGTLDVALPLADGTTYLWDYKHGHGEVKAEENWQLIDYAAGLPAAERCILRVVQPFCYSSDGPVSEWVLYRKGLRERYIPTMRASAYATHTLAGSHCRYCKALTDCVTARQYGLDLIHQMPLRLDKDMAAADRAVLWEQVKDGLPVLKELMGQLEDEVKEQLPPGYMVEVTKGRLNWSAPVPQVIALGQLLGADLGKPAVVTPTQARKLVPAEMYDACVKPLTKRDAGATKLVRAKDSRVSRAFQPKN